MKSYEADMYYSEGGWIWQVCTIMDYYWITMKLFNSYYYQTIPIDRLCRGPMPCTPATAARTPWTSSNVEPIVIMLIIVISIISSIIVDISSSII